MTESEIIQQFIDTEKKRMAALQPQAKENIASEMASRGLLGGTQHMSQLGELDAKTQEYLSRLAEKLADAKSRDVEREQQKEEAKKARRFSLISGLAGIVLPWGLKKLFPLKYPSLGQNYVPENTDLSNITNRSNSAYRPYTGGSNVPSWQTNAIFGGSD